jgi:hypothetical protein
MQQQGLQVVAYVISAPVKMNTHVQNEVHALLFAKLVKIIGFVS